MEKDSGATPQSWKVSLSIIMGIGWIVFVITWLAFFAGNEEYNFNAYQNFAIILISILVELIVLGGVWASYGIKKIPDEGKQIMKAIGFFSRVVVSMIIPLGLMIFLIIWFFFYAEDFDIYKNFAVFLGSILIMIAIISTIWAPWGMEHGKKFEKFCKDENK